MHITPDDISYAFKDMERSVRGIFGDREWETEFAKRSQDIWFPIMEGLYYGTYGTDKQFNAKSNISMRRLLTLVFATIYHANGKQLPVITRADFNSNSDAYTDKDDSDLVFDALKINLHTQLNKMNPVLAEHFFLFLGQEKLSKSEQKFVCLCVLSLVRKYVITGTVPENSNKTKKEDTLPGLESFIAGLEGKGPAKYSRDLDSQISELEDKKLEDRKRNAYPFNKAISPEDLKFLSSIKVKW